MGDPVCWLERTCLSCGRFLDAAGPPGEPDGRCPHCGSELPPPPPSAPPSRPAPPPRPSPPRITGLAWGRISTEAGVFRDAKLWPGGGRNWDWNETGTDHASGIRPADVAEVLDHGARVVVLGRGQHERLAVGQACLALVEAAGATCEVLPTPAATERYNALAAQGVAVGALIHTTC